MKLSERDIARFWSKVDVRGADECWNWIAGKFSNGYGSFAVDGASYGAHVIAFQISKGRAPREGYEVAHAPVICHTRACCNFAHLSEKTKQENEDDKRIDGTRPHGEGNSQAKLTQAKVEQIRALRSRKPPVPQRVVADMLNTSQSNVSLIERGKAWKERETK